MHPSRTRVVKNIAMPMAGIEKRADVDEFTQNVGGELSDLRREIVSERASSRQDRHHRGLAGSEHPPQHDVPTDPSCAWRFSGR